MAKYVYLGRDNEFYATFYEDGEAYDLSNVTKMAVHFDDTVIDSDAYSDAFDWNRSTTGEVKFMLGAACETESVSTGAYRAEVYIYDANHTNGVFWDYMTIVVVDLSS